MVERARELVIKAGYFNFSREITKLHTYRLGREYYLISVIMCFVVHSYLISIVVNFDTYITRAYLPTFTEVPLITPYLIEK
jgi:hypothetical protein